MEFKLDGGNGCNTHTDRQTDRHSLSFQSDQMRSAITFICSQNERNVGRAGTPTCLPGIHFLTRTFFIYYFFAFFFIINIHIEPNHTISDFVSVFFFFRKNKFFACDRYVAVFTYERFSIEKHQPVWFEKWSSLVDRLH